MANFKTIIEKADEWGVSTRYVQSLCKQEKIKGAVKRAGAWFIPDTAVNPAINTKSNAPQLMFKGTKKKIFEKAVELFAQKSYDIVTIKDIANGVGIRQSAVYNHFKSKQEILDTIYDFYCHYFIVDRPSLESLEPVLKYGSLLEIINCVNYEFDEEYREFMVYISKIIFQRNSIDERAREISFSLIVEEGNKFVEAVFNRAIEIGRLAPLDTHMMAVFCNSNRFYMFYSYMINPSHLKESLDDQQTLNSYAVKYLIDLNPPIISQ